MLLTPKNTITYGPVNSRRLGRSLGVNILPPGQKTCTFNCVYCQYGWTDYEKIANINSLTWPSSEDVGEALKEALLQLDSPPAYITFSGNGEPTLHPSFPEIVTAVNSIRDQRAPCSQTAILSNSSLVSDSSIQKALSLLDRRIMKLDCGDRTTYHRYNKPNRGLELEDIADSMEKMEDIVIQALFSAGDAGNLTPANLEAWLVRIKKIRPDHVQIYSLDRDAPAEKLIPASESALLKIKNLVNEAGIEAEVYTRQP
jgi:wyosine [tRNA(Phe)-imidazoG37] synthetase (radical SAM superfamily)